MALGIKPRACSGCPRSNRGVGFVRPCGQPEAKFIIIGQGPSLDDAYQSQAFFSKDYTGGVMTDRLYRAGLQRSDVIFTDLVWCSTRDAYSPYKKMVDPAHEAVKYCWKTHLGPFLDGLPKLPRPRHLITIGSPALRWFKGMTQKEPAEPHFGTTTLIPLPEVPRDAKS